MPKKPTTRAEAVRLIDAAGKRDEFVAGWLRTPEQYFAEYGYLEPQVWQDVLNDLGIEAAAAEPLA